MNVSQFAKELQLEILSEGDMSKNIDGCYCSDLLSHCMSNIEKDNIWVTVQVNINIIAIAVLTELSAILISQDMPVEQSVIDKAKSENVTVLRSSKTSYELCLDVGRLI